MGFKCMKESIMQEFNKNNSIIKTYAKNNNLSSLKCKNKYKVNNFLNISYPGYKTRLKDEKVIYDYRVDYIKNNKEVAVSHPAIILDLYNKVLQKPELARRWKEFLIDVAYNGENTDLSKYNDLNNTKYLKPNDNLINELNNIFKVMDKSYLSKTNLKFNFTLEELKYLISWIALQEDINYPLSKNSKLQGRKMPFYRYIEALFIASGHRRVGERNLEVVIKRAIVHNQPDLWKPAIDYSRVERIEE